MNNAIIRLDRDLTRSLQMNGGTGQSLSGNQPVNIYHSDYLDNTVNFSFYAEDFHCLFVVGTHHGHPEHRSW